MLFSHCTMIFQLKCMNHLHGQNSFDHGQFVNLWSKTSILTMVKSFDHANDSGKKGINSWFEEQENHIFILKLRNLLNWIVFKFALLSFGLIKSKIPLKIVKNMISSHCTMIFRLKKVSMHDLRSQQKVFFYWAWKHLLNWIIFKFTILRLINQKMHKDCKKYDV